MDASCLELTPEDMSARRFITLTLGTLALSSLGLSQQVVLISNITPSAGNGVRVGQGSTFKTVYFGFTTPSDAYVPLEVDVMANFNLCGVGNGGSTWRLRSDSGGLPGTPLGHMTPQQVLGGPGLYTFAAPPNVVLAADTTYWVEGRANQPTVNCFAWRGTSASTPPTGIATSDGYLYEDISGAISPLGTSFQLQVEVRGELASPIQSYCGPANANSSGWPATIEGIGSAVLAQNDLVLQASQLPPSTFGFFLCSRTQEFFANPGGSAGNLCLGGSIGRYVGPGQVQNSGAAGTMTLAVDWMQMPQPTLSVAAMVGERWNFTAWFRDNFLGISTSNFTNGLSVDVQ